MGVTRGAVTVAATAALLTAAYTEVRMESATAARDAGSPVSHAALVSPPPAKRAPNPVPPPDPDGNPACPVSDAWGNDFRGNGVFVTYWGAGPDQITVLVRTTTGNDVAQSLAFAADQQMQLFDFPNVNGPSVREVLIITDSKRCFAIADPATSGR